jgi:hypothetical protein
MTVSSSGAVGGFETGAAFGVPVVVVVVVVVVLGAVWAWILAQADIAATITATSRDCLGVYFIVGSTVWLVGKWPRAARG